MRYELNPMTPEHLDELLRDAPQSLLSYQLAKAYFSPGSASLCLLVDGRPVFAGGIVNLQWRRGEAWILPTAFFRTHVKTCMKALKDGLPLLAKEGDFRRVQATCIKGISETIFRHLGFDYEGTLKKFGPNGETCAMYARLFDVEIR